VVFYIKKDPTRKRLSVSSRVGATPVRESTCSERIAFAPSARTADHLFVAPGATLRVIPWCTTDDKNRERRRGRKEPCQVPHNEVREQSSIRHARPPPSLLLGLKAVARHSSFCPGSVRRLTPSRAN
jgi:hypothetical protein